MLPNCLDVGQNLRESFEEFFSLADESIELSDIIMKGLDDLGIKNDELSKYQLALASNFHKAINSFLSIVNLCNMGFIEDAKTITRKVIEIAVTLKYISIDPEKRGNQYFHFWELSNYKILTDLQKVDKGHVYTNWVQKELGKHASRIEKEYEESKAYFDLNKKGEVKGEFLRKWSGKIFEQMAIESGLSIEVRPYKLYCIATHVSIEDLTNYYDPKMSCFRPDLSIDDVPFIIIETVRMYLVIIELIVNEFNLKLDDSLSLVREHLEKFKDHDIFKS